MTKLDTTCDLESHGLQINREALKVMGHMFAPLPLAQRRQKPRALVSALFKVCCLHC